MNKNVHLKLGDKVYGIYGKQCILPCIVYALADKSFIVSDYQNKAEDAQEWRFADFGEKWFTDLDEAKKKLWVLYDNNYEKYEIRADGDDSYSVYLK